MYSLFKVAAPTYSQVIGRNPLSEAQDHTARVDDSLRVNLLARRPGPVETLSDW